jgi:Tfp pilus assembly protein PilN
MIRINLLPVEYRKKSRTPIKLVLGLLAAVSVNAGLAAWWAWSAVGEQATVESEQTALQLEMDGLTPQVNYHKSLESEKKQYQSREQTLTSITNSRVSWTRKLDELLDVVNRGNDGQRHLVWFDDLQVAQATDTKGKSPGSLRANAHSGSDQYTQIANFLEDLEKSPFITDFKPPAPPEGSQSMTDETLMPPTAWSFPLSVTLKSVEERTGKADPKAKPDPKAANGGAQAKTPAKTEEAKQ